MTDRESSWGVEGVTLSMLRHIAGLGYVVSVHRNPGSLLGTVPAFVEFSALVPGGERFTVRVEAGEVDDVDYLAAVRLGEMVGIEWEG